jgi:multiple sugar transport system substrate-binding protein
LAACVTAGQAPAGSSQGAAASGEAVKVTWFVRDDAIVNPWEDKMMAAFSQNHANIKVEWISGGQGPEREAKFTALIAGGTPPDIFSSWQEAGFGDYAARKLALNLNPFLEKSTDLDLKSIPEALMKTYERNGELLGIPFASGASYLYYNKKLFDAAGVAYPTASWDDPNWTWDTFVEMAKKLTKDYGNPNATYGANLGMWPSNALSWLFSGDFYPEEAYTTGFFKESVADSENTIAAYQAQNDLIYKHQVSPSPALNDAMSSVGDPFKTGHIAMQLTGVWGFWVYSDVKDFEIGAAAFPTGKGSNRPVIFTDPWMISRESKHPNEAWEFMKVLVDPKQGGKSYVETTGVVPPAQELLPVWYDKIGGRMPWIKPEDQKALIEGSMKHGYESANHLLVGFNEMESMCSAELQAVFLNKASASDALKGIKTKLDDISGKVRQQFGQ